MTRGFVEAEQKPRRFYSEAAPAPLEGGYAVVLDGRPLRTPKGERMALPTHALAEQLAQEWAAQGEVIEMASMPATRLANTALEAIPAAREATADAIVQFAASDLLCYFAEGPEALVARQAEQWAPAVALAERELGLAFVRAAGIVHQAQPEGTLARVKALALELDDFRLAGLAFGAALFGSTILAFALQHGWLSADQAFELSRLDEAYQEEKWGVDAEAAERTARLANDARMLERWFRALE